MDLDANNQEIRISGIPISPGLARGPLFVIERGELQIPQYLVEEAKLSQEIQRLENAIQQTKEQLLKIQREVSENLGEKDAEIFEAHLLVLEDATLLGAVNKQLQLKKNNIESIYHHVANHYAHALEGLKDPYLSERAADVRDVSRRVLQNLMGDEEHSFNLSSPFIVVAQDLTPSETARLPRDKTLGFALYTGSKTSHTAIIARSMDIPAVVGLEEDDIHLETGMYAILDGTHGVLIINPTPETHANLLAVESRHEEVVHTLESLRDTKAITRDNHTIILSANIEVLDDLVDIAKCGAEGIGLFRTEFLFSEKLPDEEQQYQAYVTAARATQPHHVILRTLDCGGDKFINRYFDEAEENPFLGVRAIRFCLAHPDLFRTQLRAMLRATAEGNVKIMYPMVSGAEEVREANQILFEEKEKLHQSGIPVADSFEIGAMIEIPSAAITAEIIAREVQFFSIGSNDLIQYSIAIDRCNEHLADLYQPTHPAILRLIHQTITAAHQAGIWVGLCGEMAGDFVLTPLLIGMGIDELSTGCAQVPLVKRIVQAFSFEEMRTLASEILQQTSSQEILSRLETMARERVPELFE